MKKVIKILFLWVDSDGPTYTSHYQSSLCQNWTIFIRTIQNAIGVHYFNIGTLRMVSDTFP